MKNKNIWLVPTDKPSRLVYIKGTSNRYHLLNYNDNDYYESFNICITNDEEIEKGDFMIEIDTKWVLIAQKKYIKNKDYKKIILTLDQDLIKDGVQAIPDEFLEWFVKNPSCEEVDVEHNLIDFKGGLEFKFKVGYKIIIPKEEPKQSIKNKILYETSEETKQKARDYGDRLVNKQELERGITITHKQETLEEAALKYAQKQMYWSQGVSNGFIAGAKWHEEQERHSYSEEEVKNLIKIIEWYDENSDVRPNYNEKIGELTMWDLFNNIKNNL